jgi:hypothetical protein
MSKINVCPACNAERSGVKSRIAFDHTCGKGDEINGCVRIEFKDEGQDFLVWIVDMNDTVMGCIPFQGSVWNGCKVLNMSEVKVGSHVKIDFKGKPLTIKYPIISVGYFAKAVRVK